VTENKSRFLGTINGAAIKMTSIMGFSGIS